MQSPLRLRQETVLGGESDKPIGCPLSCGFGYYPTLFAALLKGLALTETLSLTDIGLSSVKRYHKYLRALLV